MHFTDGNRLELLTNGGQYFPVLVSEIDAARTEVFLETYIFADDRTGRLVAAALARAAARGVAVHVLIDGFGARDFEPSLRALLEQAGVSLLVFRPDISPWTFRRDRLRRMHRKLAVVDARVGFVGGINVIDDFDTPGQTPPRYDYAVRFEGPLALAVRSEAAKLWARVSLATFGKRWPGLSALMGRDGPNVPPHGVARDQGQRAALLIRDNVAHRRDIEDAYLEMIARAQEEILIASAYFFPGRRFRRALVDAAGRGVRVTLLLQGRVEYLLLHYASRALYESLLDAGIGIFEYHRGFLHAKVAVFDRRFASVGSSNIDPFSLLLAREANVFVDDAGFAGELHASLLEAIRRGAREVPPRSWKRLALHRRARIWIAYGIARLLMNFTGTAGDH